MEAQAGVDGRVLFALCVSRWHWPGCMQAGGESTRMQLLLCLHMYVDEIRLASQISMAMVAAHRHVGSTWDEIVVEAEQGHYWTGSWKLV